MTRRRVFAPLVMPSVAVALGAFTGSRPGSAEIAAAGWALCLALALAALGLARRGRATTALALLSLALGAAAAARGNALWRAPEESSFVRASRLAGFVESGEPVAVEGIVVRDLDWSPRGVGITMDVTGVRIDGGGRPCRGRLRITLPRSPADERLHALGYGDRVATWVRLREPEGVRNPGGFNMRRHLRAQGIALTGSAKSALLVERIGFDPPSRILLACHRIRRAMLARIERVFPGGGGARLSPDGALLAAFLVGARGDVAPADDEAFLAAGTYHILAISGVHVALLAALLHGVLGVIGWPGMGSRWLVVGAAVAVYAGVTEAPASVTRAAAMGAFVAAFRLLGERFHPVHAVTLAFVPQVLLWPLHVFDAGLHLTYVATMGIVALGSIHGPFEGLERFLPRRLARVVAVALGAHLSTLPVVHATFLRLAPGALALNLLAVPLSSLALGIGATGMAVPGRPGDAMLVAAGLALRIVAEASAWAASFPALSRMAAAPPPGLAAGTLLVATAAVAVSWPELWLGRRPRGVLVGSLARHLALAALLASAVAHGVTGARDARPRRLEVTVLDVGQGDAILVRAPGAAILVDGGGSGDERFDAGRRVVVPALLSLGVTHLDAVVLTHAHPDHGAGLVAVVRNLSVGELWEGVPLAEVRPASFYGRLLREAEARGVRRRRVAAGDAWRRGALSVSVLHPAPSAPPAARARNDDSVVLRLAWGGFGLLLAGDAEAGAERAIAPALAPADVLKVPHHGSRSSTTPELVDAVRPRLSIVSVGRRNPWGFPAPEVLGRLRDGMVLTTAGEGAVHLGVDASSIEVTSVCRQQAGLTPFRMPLRPGAGTTQMRAPGGRRSYNPRLAESRAREESAHGFRARAGAGQGRRPAALRFERQPPDIREQ